MITVNAAVAALIALPLVPVTELARTPIPAISKAVQDQIGWPEYVAEVAAVFRSIPAADRARAVLIASNYGEADALFRYGPALGLPAPGRAQCPLRPAPPARQRHDSGGDRRPAARRPRLLHHLPGRRASRQPLRRQQRGAGTADRDPPGSPPAMAQPVAALPPLRMTSTSPNRKHDEARRTDE